MDDLEKLLLFYILFLLYSMAVDCYCQNTVKRRWWVRPINCKRDALGYFATTYLKIKEIDPQQFFKHTRMDRALYDKLLDLVKEDLQKKSIRKPIDFECRLALTLA